MLKDKARSWFFTGLLALPGTASVGVERALAQAAQAPLKPVSVVTKTVCGSRCNYETIQAAIDASAPGWTIQVKNGSYTMPRGFVARIRSKACTKEKPCALIAYPGHKPVLRDSSHGVVIDSAWWIVDGFEVTNMSQGAITILASHVTVRNNHVHDNPAGRTGGIAPSSRFRSVAHVLIENNIVERTGIAPGCRKEGESSPRHCHGIYLSSHKPDPCLGISFVSIRGNILAEHAGSGLQMNGQGCPGSGGIRYVLVENNIFRNNASGFNFYHNESYVTIRNNTVSVASWPTTDSNSVHIFNIAGKSLRNFSIHNNVFSSTNSSVKGIFSWYDATQIMNWSVDHNTWNLRTDRWSWQGNSRKDFTAAYRSVTRWDASGTCCSSDPKFLGGTDFRLQASSPARNAGTNVRCAVEDFHDIFRPQEGRCDAGAFEYRR